MARTRRRMARPPGRRRQGRRADWVYRGPVWDSAGSLIDDLHTYGTASKVLVAGVASANGAVLYDSHNYVGSKSGLTAFDAPRMRVPSPARAEGRKAFIHRVEGTIILVPSTWTLGSTFRYGVRFGIFEQDPLTGGFLIDPNYNMWSTGNSQLVSPAVWANDRRWQHERRFGQIFTTGNEASMWQLRFRFSVRRSLGPNECYGIFTETMAGGATLNEQMWFRTLVSDEG